MKFFTPLLGAGSIDPFAAFFLVACVLAFLNGFFKDRDRWHW